MKILDVSGKSCNILYQMTWFCPLCLVVTIHSVLQCGWLVEGSHTVSLSIVRLLSAHV